MGRKMTTTPTIKQKFTVEQQKKVCWLHTGNKRIQMAVSQCLLLGHSFFRIKWKTNEEDLWRWSKLTMVYNEHISFLFLFCFLVLRALFSSVFLFFTVSLFFDECVMHTKWCTDGSLLYCLSISPRANDFFFSSGFVLCVVGFLFSVDSFYFIWYFVVFFFSLSLFLTFNSVHVLFIHTKLDVTKQMNEFSIEVS